MYDIPLAITVKSVSAGEYTAPPAHGPSIPEICGMTPEARMLRWNISAYPASALMPSWIRAPPESFSPITGATHFHGHIHNFAYFCAMVSDREPPNTVKSCANIYTRRPSIVPYPVTTPSPR